MLEVNRVADHVQIQRRPDNDISNIKRRGNWRDQDTELPARNSPDVAGAISICGQQRLIAV